jgi:hypothetical protein
MQDQSAPAREPSPEQTRRRRANTSGGFVGESGLLVDNLIENDAHICRSIKSLDFDSDPADEIIAATSLVQKRCDPICFLTTQRRHW